MREKLGRQKLSSLQNRFSLERPSATKEPAFHLGVPTSSPCRFPAFKHGLAIRTSEPLNGCVFHLPDNPSLLPNAAGREEKRLRPRRRVFDGREVTTKPYRGGHARGPTGETEEPQLFHACDTLTLRLPAN